MIAVVKMSIISSSIGALTSFDKEEIKLPFTTFIALTIMPSESSSYAKISALRDEFVTIEVLEV